MRDLISIRNGDNFIDKESESVEMFNSHYLHYLHYIHIINIVEKTPSVPPQNYVIDTNNTQEIIEGIIRTEITDINALLKQTDPKKAAGPDTIPPK